MIKVEYAYWSVSEEKWKVDVKEFDYPETARRFIIVCKKNPGMKFIGYTCIDSEDNEYIWARI